MSEKTYRLLRPGEQILQAETLLGSETATLTALEEKYYFYLEANDAVALREVDPDKIFDLARIADWTKTTMQLSNKKQRMRVPTQCVMRAVGFEPEDVDLFLDNETKSGLSAKLRQTEWYQDAHPEIKTAVLKLFAHLGLFAQQNINQRLKVVDQVVNSFTLLEIHNLFGGLRPGTCLKHILLEQDLEQGIDPSLRKRFDPTGKKTINFFLKNLSSPNFKAVACYALTHYIPEMALYSSQKKSANAMLESQCAICKVASISSTANLINKKHEEIANTLYQYHNGETSMHDNIARLQDEIESLRSNLHEAVKKDGDNSLRQLLDAVILSKEVFSIKHLEQHHSEVHFSDQIAPEIVASAIAAGYKTCDEREVMKLNDIYQIAKSAPAKCFDLSTQDNTTTGYTYTWLSPDNPALYTVAMLCGNTCMRPGFAGEAALWESALSDDVAIGAISDHGKIVAYYRVNYDKNNHGFYIDTVESRFLDVLNNEEIWLAVRRAVVEMANSMNEAGKFPVNVINFREERGNRLKVQWDNLPISGQILKARAYHHPNAPWSYGDKETRVQKEVWRHE